LRILVLAGFAALTANGATEALRRVIPLDGTWRLAEGTSGQRPAQSSDGKGGVSEIKFAPTEARRVRILCTQRGTPWGHAIRELQAFERAGNRVT
jgi:hypothetical protein